MIKKKGIIVLRPILWIFTLFFCNLLISQNSPEFNQLVNRAAKKVYSHPDESLNTLNYLSRKVHTPDERAIICLLTADAYYAKGEYDKSIEYIFDTGEDREEINDSLKIEILFRKLYISGNLGLYSQFNSYFETIDDIVTTLSLEKAGTIKARLALEKAYVDIGKKRFNKALMRLDSIEKNLSVMTIANDYDLHQDLYIAKGSLLNGVWKYKQAQIFFIKALDNYKKKKRDNIILHSAIVQGLSTTYYRQGRYHEAIGLLTVSLKEATSAGNIFLQEKLNAQLANNYLALNDIQQHQKHNGQFMSLYTKVNDNEIIAFNKFYDLVRKEQQAYSEEKESRFRLYAYIASTILFLVIVSGIILYFTNKAKKRQLKEIISYLETPNKVLLMSYPDKAETIKRTAMPTETETAILNKLKKFESSTKYTNKDMSLSTLSAMLDINTKYLSEIINKHYSDNFNTYINKLRINYIIEKLKNDPQYLNYKISYLAEESGFSSHSSFATVFKSITGISPTVFIEHLGKEVKNNKNEANVGNA